MNSNTSSNSDSRHSLPHGLAALLDDGGRVPLPLRAIDVRFEVVGDCAQVCLQQEFEHVGTNAVDVLYAFPLPSDAAVHECVMTIGDRRVAAKIKPAAEAKATYEQAKKDGKRAALVEGVRDNLFELRLGNVQPGDGIRIDFSYALPLAGDGSSRELRLPVCPGVRYVPGKAVGADGGTDLVPDAGRLARARVGAEHPDAAVFFCAGTLSAVSDLESPSHDIEQVASGDSVAVMLSGDIEFPDRDFVLTWKAEPVTTALVSPEDPQHVLCSLSASEMDDHEPEGREILFLLDSSGSMQGANWFGLLEAMELALNQLRPSDRFSIRLFDNKLHDLSNGWRSADLAEQLDCLIQLQLHRPSGGTNFTGAFQTVIREAADLRRPVVVVITDGQFGDEARATLAARNSGVEVHTFGIDANVNEGVLKKIARRTHGTCSLVSPGQDLAEKVEQLMNWLLAPMIHRISAPGDWDLVGCPPSIRKGQSALVAFRHRGDCQIPATIEVDLEQANGSRIRKSFPVLQTQGAAASVLASKFEIEALIDEGRDAEAVDLACRRNILAPGASFVAVDEAEKVVVASAIIEQANLDPNSREALMMQDLVTVHRAVRSSGPSLGFITLSNPADNTLECLTMSPSPAPDQSRRKLYSAPAPTQALLGKLFSADRGERLRVLAHSITCFKTPSWETLLNELLLPWAEERTSHERLMKTILLKLAVLGSVDNTTSEALKILSELLPYLNVTLREKLHAFIEERRCNG